MGWGTAPPLGRDGPAAREVGPSERMMGPHGGRPHGPLNPERVLNWAASGRSGPHLIRCMSRKDNSLSVSGLRSPPGAKCHRWGTAARRTPGEEQPPPKLPEVFQVFRSHPRTYGAELESLPIDAREVTSSSWVRHAATRERPPEMGITAAIPTVARLPVSCRGEHSSLLPARSFFATLRIRMRNHMIRWEIGSRAIREVRFGGRRSRQSVRVPSGGLRAVGPGSPLGRGGPALDASHPGFILARAH
jgi:hypothetical protein